MKFISYAQNFEDVLLWRALRHIPNGFYVDVGAQHPIVDSVSKAFYDRGWRGAHVEPSPEFAKLLRKFRPDEKVFEVALSDVEENVDFNVIEGTGLSTISKAYADQHVEEHGYNSRSIKLVTTTLNNILHEFEGVEIHWLKIDVEGFEAQVLKGWDVNRYRPWVMIVEATIPNSSQVNYEAWEAVLLDGDYEFVYFDGLNRFYVAKEHRELLSAFMSPPNVFDEIQLTANSSMVADVLKGVSESERILSSTQAELINTQIALRNATEKYMAVINSNSWKLTLPIRFTGHFLRKVVHVRDTNKALFRFIKSFLTYLRRQAQSFPMVIEFIDYIVSFFPAIKVNLLVWTGGSAKKQYLGSIAKSSEHLPSAALTVYKRLKKSLSERKLS